MSSTLYIQTQVLPGNRVELDTPDLAVGAHVEVTVQVAQPPPVPRRSILDVLEEIHTRIPPGDPEEMDRRWGEEREAWDR